ncbi:MAG TPA: UDP-N-acetylmuramate dehydrogenase [Phycisphaerae bacterium]|nr:UDP-N-acetylmuramate dehydrogenase [Phycisphaerae bacterium]
MTWYADFEPIVRLNVPLAPLTWFRLGGPAKYFIEPRDVAELSAILKRLHENNIPVYVLGGGANLLVNDQGVDGAVISLTNPEFRKIEVQGCKIKVGAGFDVQKLVRESARLGLGGLECLAGIPGSVGGEIRMNAGGAFGDIGSSVSEVTVMDSKGVCFTRRRDDLNFSYRRSNITAKLILDATFELTPGNPDRLVSRVKEIWMYKRNTQPLAENSAGCIFKNSNGTSAGALIDRASLKGASVGGASVSDRHANFIVARQGSTSADVISLIDLIRKKVKEHSGVTLETEVVIW